MVRMQLHKGLNARELAPRARFELATLRLTAECSTVELPGNAQRACFHSITRSRIRHDLSVAIRLLTLLERRYFVAVARGF